MRPIVMTLPADDYELRDEIIEQLEPYAYVSEPAPSMLGPEEIKLIVEIVMEGSGLLANQCGGGGDGGGVDWACMGNTWSRPDGFENIIELLLIQMAYISKMGPFTQNPSGLFFEKALNITDNDRSVRITVCSFK